jgi:hypothetical protein
VAEVIGITGQNAGQGAPESAASNVIRLLKKDLRQHRWLMPQLAVFEIVSFEVLHAQTGPRATPVLLLLLGWIAAFVFCFRTAVAEEKARAYRFLMALPLTAAELVGAKYLFNALLVVGNFIVLQGYLLAASGLLSRPLPGNLSPELLVLLLGAQLLASGLFLAVAVLLDSSRAVWIPFPFIWVAASLSAGIPSLARKLGIDWASAWPAVLRWTAAAVLVLALMVAMAVPAIARRRRWS